MPSVRNVDQPVQLRRDASDDEYVSDVDENVQLSESNRSSDEQSGTGSANDETDTGDEGVAKTREEDDLTSQSSENERDGLTDISFGALAKAQATFAPSTSRKRKVSNIESTDKQQPLPTTTIDNPHPTFETLSKKPRQDVASRTSKHAPAVLSSRNPVSRKRTVISPPPMHKSRDPRFDPAITTQTLNTNAISRASKAYSFLTDYQADEILALKSEIKKVQKSNPNRAAELKKELMSMESRLRNAETRSKEREILARHKTQEKQAIREGKKDRPYFLKKSDLRKEIQKERVEGMGKKQRDKMEKRKRMREKTKEARDMPWSRRMG